MSGGSPAQLWLCLRIWEGFLRAEGGFNRAPEVEWGLCPGCWGLRCRGERLWDSWAVAQPSSGKMLSLGVGGPASGQQGYGVRVGLPLPVMQPRAGSTWEATQSLCSRRFWSRADWGWEAMPAALTGPGGQCHRAQWAVMVGTWRTGWGPTVSGKQEAQDLLLDGSGQGRGGLWSLGCQVSDLGSGRHVVPSLRGGY